MEGVQNFKCMDPGIFQKMAEPRRFGAEVPQ